MAKIRDEGEGRYSFYCPGCDHMHIYFVNSPHWHKDSQGWTFNGNFDKPSFTPSLLNTWGKNVNPKYEEPEGPAPKNGWSGVCHLFVTDGVINYCGDCTHDHNGLNGVSMKEI